MVQNMMAAHPKEFSVVGIKHALTLAESPDPDLRPQGAFSMRGHSVGGFGSVTTNKLIASFVGELFNIYVQAYPKYGSEKKGVAHDRIILPSRRNTSALTANSRMSSSFRSTT
jgi:pyruvate-ferredoxin/flavodoxin oxidoreductase